MINGFYSSYGSAARSRAALTIDAGRYVISSDDGDIHRGKIESLTVSDRLGNVERTITLEDGSVFISKDNNAIDILFKPYIQTNHFIHSIESNFGWVVVALIVAVLTTFSFFKWGIPYAGHSIAHMLPHKTNEIIGANTLEFLDDYIFENSQLELEQQNRIREHFQSNLLPLEKQSSEINYQLHFRAWDEGEAGIPNALALPSGDIILTDKFVELSQNQNEIDAVLLHEMGHVIHRHSLETVIQGTLMTTFIMMTTGDMSTAGDLGIGIGSLLVSTNYSRKNESEADLYAFEHMLEAGIDPTSFSSIMDRITNYDGDSPEREANSPEREKNSSEREINSLELNKESQANTDPNQEKDNEKDKETIEEGPLAKKAGELFDYISTHPSTADRIKMAEHYSQCYREGLVICDYITIQ